MTPAVMALGDQDFGAGFIGFAIVVVLGVALFFLLRSMNKHLRNVPDSFDAGDPAAPPEQRAADSRPPRG